ncbi:hypothetical protein ACH40D_02860 [Streptomyces olivaceoviridis]|uniref:Uncharacterized protein n=1 Tax=Streptomyces olivaceoviridis TaxID=1921 RepID=A0ABW7UZY4_STROI|nr:hypothetical protein [Streptomyces corchorusii]
MILLGLYLFSVVTWTAGLFGHAAVLGPLARSVRARLRGGL